MRRSIWALLGAVALSGLVWGATKISEYKEATSLRANDYLLLAQPDLGTNAKIAIANTVLGRDVLTNNRAAAAVFKGNLNGLGGFFVDGAFLYYGSNVIGSNLFWVNVNGQGGCRDIWNVGDGTNTVVRLLGASPAIFSNGVWAFTYTGPGGFSVDTTGLIVGTNATHRVELKGYATSYFYDGIWAQSISGNGSGIVALNGANVTYSSNWCGASPVTYDVAKPYQYTNATTSVIITNITGQVGINDVSVRNSVLIVSNGCATNITLTIPGPWLTGDGARSYTVATNARLGVLSVNAWGAKVTNAVFRSLW
jgi:hypothetical protein